MIKAAVASANAASASNNDDLQQEMQRIFRPEKLMAQFKAYLSSTATDYYNKTEDETKSTLPTLDECSKSLLPLLDALMNQTKSTPEWVFRSRFSSYILIDSFENYFQSVSFDWITILLKSYSRNSVATNSRAKPEIYCYDRVD